MPEFTLLVVYTFQPKSIKQKFFENFSKEMVISKMLIAHYLPKKTLSFCRIFIVSM